LRQREFIDAVYAAVYKTAIDGVIRLLVQPPGRRPRSDIVNLSSWYNGLNDDQQNLVQDVVRLTADQAVFGMLAALDGARSLGPDARLILNSDGTDLTAPHELHDLFRDRVDQELEYDQ
jgi:hypothetical protein